MNTNLFFLFLFSFSFLFLFLLNWQNSDPGWLPSLYPKRWWTATANENGHWCYISYFLVVVAVTKHLIRNSLEEAHSEGMKVHGGGMVWCQGNGDGMVGGNGDAVVGDNGDGVVGSNGDGVVSGQWGWCGGRGFMKAGASRRCLFTSLLIWKQWRRRAKVWVSVFLSAASIFS